MTLQQGVGEGTVTGKRRTPRMRVQDVAITEASGLTQGDDGKQHPLESTAEGNLKVISRHELAVLEEIRDELQALHRALVQAGIVQE